MSTTNKYYIFGKDIYNFIQNVPSSSDFSNNVTKYYKNFPLSSSYTNSGYGNLGNPNCFSITSYNYKVPYSSSTFTDVNKFCTVKCETYKTPTTVNITDTVTSTLGIVIVGAGGGGGGGASSNSDNYGYGGGGGGSGGIIVSPIYTIPKNLVITIGLGGTGGNVNGINASDGNTGQPGGTTKVFTNDIEFTCNGGGGGGGGAYQFADGNQGQGGAQGNAIQSKQHAITILNGATGGSFSDANILGGNGAAAATYTANITGVPYLNAGGKGDNISTEPAPSGGHGGGWGGVIGSYTQGAGYSGGSGNPGVVYLYYYV